MTDLDSFFEREDERLKREVVESIYNQIECPDCQSLTRTVDNLKAEIDYISNRESTQGRKSREQENILVKLHEKLLPWRQTQTIDPNFDLITSLDKLIAEVWNYRRNNSNTLKITNVRFDG